MTIERFRNQTKGDREMLAFVSDQYPGDSQPYNMGIHLLLNDRKALHGLWNDYRDYVLPEFVEMNPGKRLSLWWEYDAPQINTTWPGVTRITDPRIKVSGYLYLPWDSGKSIKPYYHKGIPCLSRVFDIYLVENPAMFESEATYLKRHGLLSKTEESQLTETDFAPESFLDVLLERKKIRPY